LFVDHAGAEKSGNFLAIILGAWALGLSLGSIPFSPLPLGVPYLHRAFLGGQGGGGRGLALADESMNSRSVSDI
jgi:hypothetical protein